MLESSWRDDVTVVVSPFLGAVAALDKEPTRSITVKAGSEGTMVWSTRCDARCTQGAHFLKCMRLRVIADNSLRHDRWFVHHARLDPSFMIGLARHGTK